MTDKKPRKKKVDPPAVTLTADQVVDLCAILSGLGQYAREHACPTHIIEVASLVNDAEMLCGWLSDNAVLMFGEEDFTDAIRAYEAVVDAQVALPAKEMLN